MRSFGLILAAQCSCNTTNFVSASDPAITTQVIVACAGQQKLAVFHTARLSIVSDIARI